MHPPAREHLIHQLSSRFGGKLTEIGTTTRTCSRCDTIKAIYKKHTKLREGELEEMLKRPVVEGGQVRRWGWWTRCGGAHHTVNVTYS